MKLLSQILNAFTGPRVRLAGFILTAAGAFSLYQVKPQFVIFYLACLVIALIATFTQAFKFLANFADQNNWPAFVGLGVCIMLGAFSGGLYGMLACVGPLTAFDGMYFDQNY